LHRLRLRRHLAPRKRALYLPYSRYVAAILQLLPVLNRVHVFEREMHLSGDDLLALVSGGDVADLPRR
jgi:hypothetical protein